MTMYSKLYGKVYFGFLKIEDCIQSCETLEQLEACARMIENWVDLIDHYAGLIYRDRSISRRKIKANNLACAGKGMLDTLQEDFKNVNDALIPPTYEGRFPAVRIRSLQEYGESMEL